METQYSGSDYPAPEVPTDGDITLGTPTGVEELVAALKRLAESTKPVLDKKHQDVR